MTTTKNFFRASADDFQKIPGAPVAYWVSEAVSECFKKFKTIAKYTKSSVGLQTGDNEKFIRMWWEISFSDIKFDAHSPNETFQAKRYFPYNKGGSFRKWHGNNECVVVWRNNGEEIKQNAEITGHHWQEYAEELKFQPMVTWSRISSGNAAFRYKPFGYMSDMAGFSLYPIQANDINLILGFTNSKPSREFLKFLSPTLNFMLGQMISLPLCCDASVKIQSQEVVKSLVSLSVRDYAEYETSWDFEVNPLVGLCASLRQPPQGEDFQPPQGEENPVNPVHPVEKLYGHAGRVTLPEPCESLRPLRSLRQPPQGERIEKLYAQLRAKWARDCEEMRRLETENNRIFIDAYGLQDELSPDVPWHEITLTCNPFYRYGVKTGLTGFTGLEAETENPVNPVHPVEKLPLDPDLESRLRADTVKELVSYAVGCMMGRYSLEKPSLVLADQGSSVQDYYDRIDRIQSGEAATTETQNPVNLVHPVKKDPTEVRFSPDEDGIIPILDADWFADDIVTRFKAFVKAAFGEEHFFENMAWIEEALGKDVRSYFTKDFYKDHLQRYQNRPIYWLFQSPKGAFRALVYMHRYKPDMVGGVLGYLRSLQTKIDNQLDVALKVAADESKAASERVRANKDAAKYAKVQKELDEYEKNVLYPLSTERIEIDLDDGVKTNYRKFGAALAKVKALEGKSA